MSSLAYRDDIDIFAQIEAMLRMELQDSHSVAHKHKCNACGHVWSHRRCDIVNNQAAHTCPCGEEQYKIFRGADA